MAYKFLKLKFRLKLTLALDRESFVAVHLLLTNGWSLLLIVVKAKQKCKEEIKKYHKIKNFLNLIRIRFDKYFNFCVEV